MNEHDDEPVHGLPAELPAGERILWQGSPCPVRLARTAFHLRGVIFYFVLLAIYNAGSNLYEGAGVFAALVSVAWTAVPALMATGVVVLVGYAYAHGTVYTLTDRRLVIRSGIALTMAANIPYNMIDGVALKSYGDGSGDLVIKTRDDERASWLMLWPNVRPWHWRMPEPMLRVVPEAALVASLMTRELRRENRMEEQGHPVPEVSVSSDAQSPQLASALS